MQMPFGGRQIFNWRLIESGRSNKSAVAAVPDGTVLSFERRARVRALNGVMRVKYEISFVRI